MSRLATVTETVLRRLADELAGHPDRIRVCRAGISMVMDRSEWLLSDTAPMLRSDDDSSPRILVTAAPQASAFQGALARARDYFEGKNPTVVLVLGTGEVAGHIAAAHLTRSRTLQPLDAVRIVAPGLPYVPLGDAAWADGRSSSNWIRSSLAIRRGLSPHEIWSRSMGALGEVAWQRMAALHVGVVGCGRTGSLVATSLKRSGVRRLSLVDPDRLEPHNLGEMDAIDAQDLGQPKVQALAQCIQRQDLGISQTAETIAETVLSFSALVALKATDVVFCCVDNPAARLITACIAVLYLKPIIDLGTGVLNAAHLPRAGLRPDGDEPGELGPRQMGADVRLILPGRCLLCHGGIADLGQALEQLLGEASVGPLDVPTPWRWREERAGSLRSLNGVAVNLGLRLLEDFLGGRLAESTWLHVEFSDQGIPSIEHRLVHAPLACRLCALASRGDDGLRELRVTLQSLRAL